MASRRTSRRAALDRLIAFPFAHRGLHGSGRIENSRAAFAAAIEAGHGIELDVQSSRDGTAFVFHDSELDRLTSVKGPFAERSAAELQAMRLHGGETVPPLTEILRLIGGNAPLLIEVKAPNRDVARLCLSVFRSLEAYRGPVAIMSFNPEVGRWFARHAPRILRGLVVTESGKTALRGRVERQIALWRARPDFLGYDIRDLPSSFAAAQRRRGLPTLTWTVRSEEERARAARHADQIIYEAQTPS
ncbi:glycerophosphodiester phosphodiesterase family protein [Sphingosinicella rhizophila]|uniref:Glycerophosphodiester phosphodiesterase family protein n=1 Tax=Sphingosinicella rhizophila TaxID=3050082 RepID=A0ABU3Q7F4_9SPHN|nr:glycerophosphodiester phosphodiesterase family protein [Sphingosinicella sp. GR2756]MDT9599334.1 glycerophosphodiester phosphodiesterase family protein [Sphingosinicella sp. GR2756]